MPDITKVDFEKWLKTVVGPFLDTEGIPENVDFTTQGADLNISGDGIRLKVHLGPASFRMLATGNGILRLKLQDIEIEFAPDPKAPEETGETNPKPVFEPGPE